MVAVVSACVVCCMQPEESKSRLQASVMSDEAVVGCKLRWRSDCTRLAVIKAAMWLPHADSSPTPMEDPGQPIAGHQPSFSCHNSLCQWLCRGALCLLDCHADMADHLLFE